MLLEEWLDLRGKWASDIFLDVGANIGCQPEFKPESPAAGRGGRHDGSPRAGGFVSVGEDGLLGEFYYYPEGNDDPRSKTGAHFHVPAGATLREDAGSFSFQVLEAALLEAGFGLLPPASRSPPGDPTP